MNHLGEKIKELRRARDMTQDALANCLGVTYQTVSKWETGVTSPDLSLIVPLARLFRVTTDELFCYSESANELKRAELQKRYDDTFKTGSIPDRTAICDEAVKEFPDDMKWLNEYAWCVWCTAVTIRDEAKYSIERDKAIELFRRVIDNCNDDKTKANAIEGIVQCLPDKGAGSEALQYAEMYPQVEFDPNRREELIISCLTGDEQTSRRENQMIKKLESLTDYLDVNVKAERDILKKLIGLFFPDGNYLLFNYKMYSAALADARAKINTGELDEAAEYMKTARYYAEKYDEVDSMGEYAYTAPLFSHVKGNSANWCKTGETTTIEDYLALFGWPSYAPLKAHKEYENLIKR